MLKVQVLVSLTLGCMSMTHVAFGKEIQENSKEQTTASEAPTAAHALPAFTGKIIGNKVRMRLHPNLESPIVQELAAGDMVVVDGEIDDFYAVEPSSDIKAYIFRTYVLDGVVEGSHVNVRLEPDLTAPVMMQMNSGDAVKNAAVYQQDKKWLEFTPPASVRFFIAKEYIEKVGDRQMIARMKKRQGEVQALLQSAAVAMQVELKKPFDQMRIEDSVRKLNRVIQEYFDFPEETVRAKELLSTMQSTFMQKKMADMEMKIHTLTTGQGEEQKPSSGISSGPSPSHMSSWKEVEQSLYAAWAAEQPGQVSIEEFYDPDSDRVIAIQGIVEPYQHAVRNKPGDYLLISQTTQAPIAYLYSTRVNLQDKIGQVVLLKAQERDNHHFALPAYFVVE